jgi:hypothetical protein
MIECFVPAFGSSNGNLEVFLDLALPNEIIQASRPEISFQDGVFGF